MITNEPPAYFTLLPREIQALLRSRATSQKAYSLTSKGQSKQDHRNSGTIQRGKSFNYYAKST